jgi:hypothetical protein
MGRVQKGGVTGWDIPLRMRLFSVSSQADWREHFETECAGNTGSLFNLPLPPYISNIFLRLNISRFRFPYVGKILIRVSIPTPPNAVFTAEKDVPLSPPFPVREI